MTGVVFLYELPNSRHIGQPGIALGAALDKHADESGFGPGTAGSLPKNA